MVESVVNRTFVYTPELADSVFELRRDVARKLLIVFISLYLAWHFAMTVVAPIDNIWHVWEVSLVILPAVFIVWLLLPRWHHLSQTLWHIALVVGILLAARNFNDTRIYFLFAFIPFSAVITQGWKTGLLLELALGGAAWCLVFVRLPVPPVSLADGVAILACGLGGGFLGWAIADTILTVGEWYVGSFMHAKNSIEEIRLQRVQLAQVIKNLDQAYYRLQRTNAELVAAWKVAAEAERLKTEFATHISHELRTPLNLIAGFSEMMMTSPENYGDAPLPGAYRRDLNTIYRSARHMLDLVDDVIDLARLDAGRISINPEPVDPAAMVLEAVSMVRSYIEAKGLECITTLEPELLPMRVDRLRIRQVLLNLLVNASRFTEKGSIEAAVSCREGYIHFAVRDTGRGIHPEDLDNLFMEFNPGERPKDRGVPWHSGSGLGLPISKKFVELHHGRIGVESELGKGTTIWFEIPSMTENEPRGTAQELDRPGEVPVFLTDRDLAQPEAQYLAVLVHPDRRLPQFLQRHLSGWRVVGVKRADQVADVMKNGEVAAILVDSHEEIPQFEYNLPVVACPLPSGRRLAAGLGVQAFMSKPVTREDLFDAIDRLQLPVRRVLVVDDDLEMVHLLQRMLLPRIRPEDCQEAYTGREALEMMRQTPPDLLLLDLMMPELDGRELLAEMRAHPGLSRIPVIVISALEEPATELLGEMHVIPPVSYSPARMLGLVKKVLDELA
jgi:signal transduction histidine kinase/CheY-like chemotaxis protein